MADIEALRVQTYSTNLEMLLQQKGSKFRDRCRVENAANSKAHRFLSQISATEVTLRTTRAEPLDNQRLNHDGRWVYPKRYHFDTYVDDIDLIQTNIQPEGVYVQSAIAAMNRQSDDDFLSAFFGSAQTGETGGTSTTFTTANQVLTTVGDTTGLNVEKLRTAMKILLQNEVDLEFETPVIALSPLQHDNLLAFAQVTSTDFNRPVLQEGKVKHFMGFDFIISNRLPTDSSSYRRLPVWVKSGMGRGVWKEISGDIRKDPSKKGNPTVIEAEMQEGFTRLEEAKCVEIKCAE